MTSSGVPCDTSWPPFEPAPGPATTVYGGNTSCVEMRAGDHLLVFDSGTGFNPVSSDAIKQARASTDATKRKELYTTAQKELVNGVPFIWLFVGRDYNATLPTTKGFIHLPTGSIIYLRQTWLDK